MTNSPSQPARILIVDDHQGLTHLWKTMLEKKGRYVVQEENRSPRAVAAARAFQPDLVLLDMDMPHLDGAEVAAALRAEPALARICIVFLTSMVTPEEVAAGRLIEGYPCLSKPTSMAELVEIIGKSLAAAKRQLRQVAATSTF